MGNKQSLVSNLFITASPLDDHDEIISWNSEPSTSTPPPSLVERVHQYSNEYFLAKTNDYRHREPILPKDRPKRKRRSGYIGNRHRLYYDKLAISNQEKGYRGDGNFGKWGLSILMDNKKRKAIQASDLRARKLNQKRNEKDRPSKQNSRHIRENYYYLKHPKRY